MTREELIEQVESDPAILKQISEIENPAALIAFAKEKGLEITENEAKEAISQLCGEEGELGADSLTAVSGGKKC